MEAQDGIDIQGRRGTGDFMSQTSGRALLLVDDPWGTKGHGAKSAVGHQMSARSRTSFIYILDSVETDQGPSSVASAMVFDHSANEAEFHGERDLLISLCKCKNSQASTKSVHPRFLKSSHCLGADSKSG